MPEEIRDILLKLEECGFEAYLVGGFVRDYLLNRDTNDFDIATNALPRDIIEIFGPSKRKIEYGSYNLKLGNYNIDITTYRRELEYDGRYPVKIEYTCNLILDAERRDFTINALYMNKSGEIIDPLLVRHDIDNKRIRLIGNERKRLKEDPLRILRAVRFSCVYNFKLDKELKKAIKKEKKSLLLLSKERIKKELDVILMANGFSLLKKLDLLKILGIKTQKIVYVDDLAGLFAQIDCDIEYPKEKNLKKREKNIRNQIKCDTMNMLWLYKNGYYESKLICKIKRYSLKRLERMYSNLPIHSRNEININGEEIEELFHIYGKELGNLLDEIEEKIVLKQLENEKDKIKDYISKR